MSARLPLWLKLAYTAWCALWIPVYWASAGPANFLWLCDVANFVVLAALWCESALLFASQAVGVLLIQLTWNLDFFVRLLAGFHPVGGTEYMFDPAEPALVKALSLFHAWIPPLLLWALWRLGFDRRGWRLQAGITWLVLPLSALADPERNLNWLWQPFGVPQTVMPPRAYLLFCMAAYPLALYWPTHRLLLAWLRRAGRPILPAVTPASAPRR